MRTIIYGKADRFPDGRIRSGEPAHEHKHVLEELRESIRQKESNLKYMPDESAARLRLREEKEKLEGIERDRPVYTSAERDAAAKYCNEYLIPMLKDGQLTSTQMQMPSDYAHEEFARMTEKTIPLDPEQAKECGLALVDGKGTQTDLKIMFRDLARVAGINPNTERFRSPGKTVRYDMLTGEVVPPDAIDRRLPEHYQPETVAETKVDEPPETVPNHTLEHRGIEVRVEKRKGGRPKGSKNKPKK